MTACTTPPPVPFWIHELIEKAGQALDTMVREEGRVREVVAAAGFRTLPHLNDLQLVGYYWESDNPTYPLIDPNLISWLDAAAKADGDSDLLACFALNPSWAGFTKVPYQIGYKRDACAASEAYRVLVRTAALHPPLDLESLWKLKPCELVWEKNENRRLVFSVLTAGWSGVARSRETRPPIVQDEADSEANRRCWPVFERLLHRHPLEQYGRGSDLAIQAAFIAWKEGLWTPATFHSEVKAQPFDTQVFLNLRREDYHTTDQAFDRFLGDCAEIVKGSLDQSIENGDLEYAATNFRGVVPTLPALDVVMRIGRAIESGHPPDHITRLMRPLRAPDQDRAEAIETLKQLSAKVLIELLRSRSEWIPLILEAMPDQKLAAVLGTTIGTFSEDSLPGEMGGNGPNENKLAEIYPGRAACGFTNLQPFFDMLAITPLSTIKKALPILRKSDACDEDTPDYITHHLGLPMKRRKLDGQTAEEFIELSRRIRLNDPDREELLAKRAEFLARFFSKQEPGDPFRANRVWGLFAHSHAHTLSPQVFLP